MKTLWQKFLNRFAPIGWQDADGFHFGVPAVVICCWFLVVGCVSPTAPVIPVGNVPPNPPVLTPPSPTAMTQAIQFPLVAKTLVAPVYPVRYITITWSNNIILPNEVTALMGCTNLLNPQWNMIWEGNSESNGYAQIACTNPMEIIRAKNQFGHYHKS